MILGCLTDRYMPKA